MRLKWWLLISILLLGQLQAQPTGQYQQLMKEWSALTDFSQQSTDLIINKLTLDMKGDPKYQQLIANQALQAELKQFFYELFSAQTTLSQLTALYSQYFSLEEMQTIIQFYKSPVGQKLIKNNQILTLKTQEIGTTLLHQHEREYMQLLMKYLTLTQSR